MADTYTVERQVRVDAPASALFERIADFHRWLEWSPFERLDPEMGRTFSGADAGRGAIYEWWGNAKAGSGRMEVVEAVPGQRIVIDQRNLKPLRSHNIVTFALAESGGATTVTWSVTGEKTVAARVIGVFKAMDRMIGPVIEKGLASLKTEAESGPAGPVTRAAGKVA